MVGMGGTLDIDRRAIRVVRHPRQRAGVHRLLPGSLDRVADLGPDRRELGRARHRGVDSSFEMGCSS